MVEIEESRLSATNKDMVRLSSNTGKCYGCELWDRVVVESQGCVRSVVMSSSHSLGDLRFVTTIISMISAVDAMWSQQCSNCSSIHDVVAVQYSDCWISSFAV